jgi:acetyltransferase-like isoleucine patch superfamily enzyme
MILAELGISAVKLAVKYADDVAHYMWKTAFLAEAGANGGRVILGKSVRFCHRTVIMDSDFHGIPKDARDRSGKTLPVRIGSNVWLGSEVMILKGVTVGDDAVIGARTVVCRDVAGEAVAVGAPLRVIGRATGALGA